MPYGARAPCLTAEGISKSYGSIEALNDVSLELYPGEILGLLGDNGAGKSTLMKVLCGAHRPDSGRVTAGGALLRSIWDAQGLGVGMVYQDLALAPDLSVVENMFLGRELKRHGVFGRIGWLDRRSMRQQASQTLGELGGTIQVIDAPISTLSGGQRQLGAVARTIMDAKLALLLDEPIAALGPKQVGIVIDAVREAASRGLGVIVVSHDVPHVLQLAHRIVVLRRGRVVLDQPADSMQITTVVTAMVG